jgi:hypothetical protein
MVVSMAEDVAVPVVGKTKKTYVYAGLAVVVAAVGYYYYKQKSAPPAAAAGTGADPYPPDGTVGDPTDLYSTDPATGQTYGDEQAGYQGGSYTGASPSTATSGDAYPWDGTYNNPNDPYSMDSSTGSTYGDEGGGGGGGGGGSGPPFSTNAAWSQYVLSYFTSNGYSHIPARTSAIGKYIAGGQVDATEEGYINDAIAIGGPPPVSGTGGYPPSIRVSGGKGGGKTYADNPVKGLKVTGAYDNVTAKWEAAKNATHYGVTLTDHQGKRVDYQAVTETTITFRGLKQKTGYAVHVMARPPATSAKEAVARTTTK